MSTQTGSISFESTKGLQSYAKQNYATLSQIKGQFATSSTGASTAAKVATIVPEDSSWTLYNGATITVKFSSKNTTTSPTLNVNSTGAKPIKDYAGNALTSNAYNWPAGAAMSFTYDGSSWRLQDSDLMERVHTAESNIEQTATSITSLVSMNDNYTQPDGTTATNNLKSYINQTAEGITQSVSSTYATKTELSNAANTAEITKSASGERTIVTTDAVNLPLLTLSSVVGESVQDGTPTPDAPKYIQTVRPPARYPHGDDLAGAGYEQWKLYGSGSLVLRSDGLYEAVTSAMWAGVCITFRGNVSLKVGDKFRISVDARNPNSSAGSISCYSMEANANGTRVYTANPLGENGGSNNAALGSLAAGASTRVSVDCKWTQTCQDLIDAGGQVNLTFQTTTNGVFLVFYKPMFQMYTSVTPSSCYGQYVPYGHIGVSCSNGNITYIDLKGNELYGLDETYRDVLTIDAGGHAVVEKRTEVIKGLTGSGKGIYDHSSGRPYMPLSSVDRYGTDWIDHLGDPPMFSTRHSYGRNADGNTVWNGSTGLYFGKNSSYSNAAQLVTFLDSNPIDVVLALRKSAWYTIDLGYVDLPVVSDDSTVYVAAEVQPVIGGSWWTKSGQKAGQAWLDSSNAVEQKMEQERPYIEQNNTGSDTWTGIAPFATLKDGQEIDFWHTTNWVNSGYTNTTNYWSQNGSALDLTLLNGDTTGAIPIFYNGNTRLTSHYQGGSLIQMIYKENFLAPGYAESHRVPKAWYCKANYNSDTVYSRSISGGFYTGLNGVLSYGLCMKDQNGRWTAIVNNKYSNTTQDKTSYTGGLELGEVLYCSTWYTNGRIATNNTSVAGDLWSSYVFDFRFCTNISANSVAGKALTVRQPVYLVGTLDDDDGLFYLDTTQWWTQTPNDTNKIYIYLGTAYSWYQLNLVDIKPFYEYKDGRLIEFAYSRIKKNATDIIQTNEQITIQAASTLEASKSYTNGQISTEVTNRNAAINTKANEITSTVSANYTTKTEFNNLEIGGRNLFSWPLTGTKWKDEEHELDAYQNRGSFTQFSGSLLFDPSETLGEQYTISFWAKSPNGSTPLQLYNSNGNPKYFYFSAGALTNGLGNEWQYFSYTVTNTQYNGTNTPSTNNNYIRRIEIYAPNQMGVLIKKIKVEKGNKATDWTPAPEDIEAYTDTQISSAKSEIKQTTDNITSTVEKISSIKYLVSSATSNTLADIKTWTAEGYSTTWTISSSTPTTNVRIGDTVYIKKIDATRNNVPVYCKITVTAVPSSTQVTGISHGYEDVLPVDTIKSTINQSSDSVKISANHVDIEGAAIFSSGSLSKVVTSTQTQWYSSTSAATKENGSWGTTQPAITAGRYIWERQYITYSNGDTEYKPSEAGVCTQGQTDLSSYSTTIQMNTAIGNAVDNIEIGGTNILRDTSGNWTSTYWNGACSITKGQTDPDGGINAVKMVGTSTNDSYCRYKGYSDQIIKRTGTYTASFWAKASSNFSIDVSFNKHTIKKTCALTTNWQYFEFTGDVSTIQTSDHFTIGGWSTWKDTSVEVYFYHFKFEEGNKATAWSPSPEDVQTNIDIVQNTANNAAPKTDAIKRTQRIYYRNKVNTVPTAPTNTAGSTNKWVTCSAMTWNNTNGYSTTISSNGGLNGGWTINPGRLTQNANGTGDIYGYLYTCIQKETVAGAITCDTVLIDETSTVIDGGKIITGSVTANQIAANSITANKLTITDLTNYCQLNRNTATQYDWTVVEDSNNPNTPWFQRKTLARDNYPSEWFDCKGGEQFRVSMSVSSTVTGATTSGGATGTYMPINIGINTQTASGSSNWPVVNIVTSDSTGTETFKQGVVTIPNDAVRFRAFIQIGGWPTFAGILKIRKPIITKMTNADLIVDGAVTANKISVDNLAAINSNLGTLTAGTIDASKVTVKNLDATKITVNKIQGDQINVSSINIGDLAGEIGGRNYAKTNVAYNTSGTSNGVTFTVTGPSTVKVNGTATAIAAYGNTWFGGMTLDPGEYILWLTNTNNGTIWFRLGKTSSNTHVYSTAGNYTKTNPYKFTVTEKATYQFGPVCAAGTYSNVETSFMLEKGNCATDWTFASEDIAATATNYIHADSTGIRIASANPATQNQRLELTNNNTIFYDNNGKKRTQIDINGLHIYDTSSTPIEVALFGSTVNTTGTTAFARIGKSDSSRFEISPTTLSAYTGTTKYFEVSATGMTYGSFTAASTADIDAIEIGGQNLLTKVNQGRDPAAERTLNRGGQLFKTYGVVDNYDAEQVMGISFEAKITTTGTSRSFQVYAYQTSGETITGAINSGAAITYITPTTEWQRFEAIGYVKHYARGGNGTYTTGEVWIYDSAGTNTLQIRKVKLEKGNKITDWSPAPEDVENELIDAKKHTQVLISAANVNYTATGSTTAASLTATLYIDGVATTTGVTYQWYKDGAEISTSTASTAKSQTLTVTGTMGLAHRYSCKCGF